MERNVYQDLIRWKNKTKRKPLIVSGVRQCGKTYLMKKFGKEEFSDVAYFNFDGDVGLQSVFDYNFDTERILDELGSVVRGEKVEVGKVDRIEMHPMSFDEFVEADGGKKYIDGVNKLEREREIPELYTIPLEKYYKNWAKVLI